MGTMLNFVEIYRLVINPPVEPGAPKRPIRFNLSMRTGNPLLWISQNLPVNEAIGHPPTVESVNKTITSYGHETAIPPIVHCGLHALEVTNFNVVASNLLSTCFKSQSLPNSIIFISERRFHMFLTLCSQLKSGGGALPYKRIRDVPFFRVSFFSINSWIGYKNWSEIPKRVMTICSRTKGYCFQEQ